MSTEHDFLDNLGNHQHQKMLREIANDDLTPKKKDSIDENEFFEMRVIQNHFMSKKLQNTLINKI